MKSSLSRPSFLGFLLVLAIIAHISTADIPNIIVNLTTLHVPLQTGNSKTPGPLDGTSADYQWIVDTQVGTPGQPSRLLLDTGSSNFFITTTRCTDGCLSFFKGQDRIDTSKSSTFSSRPGSYTFNFGGGAGFLYNTGAETVVIGGSSFNQSFLSATYNVLRVQVYFDGVLGMGLDAITKPNGSLSTLHLLKNQKKIKDRVFSVQLMPIRLGGGGELVLGGYNSNKIKGDIIWSPVTSRAFWETKVSDIAVGKHDLKAGGNFIFDTGSQYILTPCQITTLIYGSLPGSKLQPNGNWTIPCNLAKAKSDKFDLKFQINNKWFSIPIIDFPTDYHIDINGERTDYCVGSVQTHPTLIVMGVPFFKSITVLFNQDLNQIGFAERNYGSHY